MFFFYGVACQLFALKLHKKEDHTRVEITVDHQLVTSQVFFVEYFPMEWDIIRLFFIVK